MGTRKTFSNVSNVIVDQEPTPRFTKPWAFSFPQGLLDMSMNLKLAEMRVLFAMTSRLDRWNFVQITRHEIGTMVGQSPEHVSTALTALADAGYIYKHGNSLWEISPDLLWFGSVAEYEGKSNAGLRGEPHKPVKIVSGTDVIAALHYRVPPKTQKA